MNKEECFLKEFMNCSCSGGGSGGGDYSNVGVERLRLASIRRNDGLHENLPSDPNVKFKCHKNCIATYTSKHHIKRFVSHSEVAIEQNVEPIAKRSRRSTERGFSFKENCIFCGEACLPLDPRHPDRWRRVIMCRTADQGNSQSTFKDAILQTCELQNDKWADEVRSRVLLALSDLHPADGKYHKACLSAFKCNIPIHQLIFNHRIKPS